MRELAATGAPIPRRNSCHWRSSRTRTAVRRPTTDNHSRNCGGAGPAVLDALDTMDLRFPKSIDERLRDWIGRVTSADPVPALALAVLDRTFRDLSTLHLACYAYSIDPQGAARLAPADRLVMTDRGCAFAVSRAQLCVAQLAHALHGVSGAQVILAAVSRERSLRRQIAEMIGSLCR
jgi:hypothetical protein